ncbi:hypothetical protein IL252_15855 [Halomicrobium sp. IBSBa]|uniref:HEAT repeat domain-containing protein n=1 Tax=Halomicrobium sp. IBSBa TaxID=2778916 RepID=UPI001ABFA978|nr:HEAT repeat domain-containing protein [Halomicrobium sp. IBSBa]MBO4249288.1 hypothetical protein [Halomicrobium sp. IBSBa]
MYEEAYDQKSFSQFLVSTNIIYDEIDRIQQENAVEEKYETLLSHDSDLIRQATAEALMEMPDVRAVEALLTQRWKDEPDLMPVVFEAAVECDGETVRDALIETLDFSNYPEIREAAVVQLQHYSGDDVVAALEETVANDSAETVQTAAREILGMVEE